MGRKIRVFAFELIGVGLVLTWIVWKSPELIDSVMPWIALFVLWHATWEFVLDPVKERLQSISSQCPVEVKWIYICVFAVGLSVLYMQWIRRGMTELSDYHAKWEAAHREGSAVLSGPLTMQERDSKSPTIPTPLPPSSEQQRENVLKGLTASWRVPAPGNNPYLSEFTVHNNGNTAIGKRNIGCTPVLFVSAVGGTLRGSGDWEETFPMTTANIESGHAETDHCLVLQQLANPVCLDFKIDH